MNRRVVVTGMGVISPIGNNLEEFWNGLLEGKCGIGPITKFDTTEYKAKLEVLWEQCKKIGFTKFFMIRIDFFGNIKIKNIMVAQELFCKENPDCYMMTRALSFM